MFYDVNFVKSPFNPRRNNYFDDRHTSEIKNIKTQINGWKIMAFCRATTKPNGLTREKLDAGKPQR